MSRRGPQLVLALAVAAIACLLAAAAIDRRDLAFTPGVPIIGAAAELESGEGACQTNLPVPAAFRKVEFVPLTGGAAGPRLSVKVVDTKTGRRLDRTSVPAGYPSARPVRVGVGRVAAGRRIDVCVTNRESADVELAGGKSESVLGSPLLVDGHEVEGWAVSLRFLRGDSRSVLSQVPLIFDRAALFRPGPVGAWTFWVLAALVAFAVPLLLAFALRRALGEAEPLA
jgi:hypothetical protein